LGLFSDRALDPELVAEELALTAFTGNSWRMVERFAIGDRGFAAR
jgi:hypothetical protein